MDAPSNPLYIEISRVAMNGRGGTTGVRVAVRQSLIERDTTKMTDNAVRLQEIYGVLLVRDTRAYPAGRTCAVALRDGVCLGAGRLRQAA